MNDGSSTFTFLILLLPLLLLAFLVFTNSRRRRQLEEFQNSIAAGDEIITSGGLYGKVVSLEPGLVHVEVAKGVVLRLDRRAVAMRAADRPTPTT
ncbi:MAG: preprotein translocase subunit YajC [Intrasporangiaceae bacterium]|nr:preprotein translocase subunit YajC [Intrasporangiaceae bacterium]